MRGASEVLIHFFITFKGGMPAQLQGKTTELEMNGALGHDSALVRQY